MVAPRALAVSVALVCSASLLHGQPAMERLPAGVRGPEVVARVFDRGSGLTAGTVFTLTRGPAGRIWLGTDDGVFVSAGGQWKPAEMPPVESRQVREIVFDSAGGRWYATRVGAFVLRNGRWQSYGVAEGVPGPVVYSAVSTNAIDGTPRMVLGAAKGVCVINGARCEPLALPQGIGTLAFMVRATTGADGTDELWVASASGGAARLRRGAWTVFTESEGLKTLSAEDVILGPAGVSDPVVVVGREGVFTLRRDDSGGERFVRVPGSPILAYRGAWITPPQAPPELWIGTSDGLVTRYRQGRWAMLAIAESLRHGQVTVLRGVVYDSVTRLVYVGTRGDQLMRMSFGAATSYALPGLASRDFVAEIAQYPGDRKRNALVISAGSVNLIDSLGRAITLESPTAPQATNNAAGYYGVLTPRAAASAPASTAAAGRDDSVAALVGTGRGILRYDGRAWNAMPGAEGAFARDIKRLPLPDGSEAVVAATSLGVKMWSGTRWTSMPGLPTFEAAAVNAVTASDGVQLIMGSAIGVFTMTRSGVRFDSVRTRDMEHRAWFGSLCAMRSGGRTRVFVGTDQGTVYWRDADSISAWHTLPERLAGSIGALSNVPLACADSTRLFAGSRLGLSVFDVAATDPSAWRLAALLGREDGLAANEVSAIGRVRNGRVWVGTVFGPSLVDMSQASIAPSAPLAVRVFDDPRGPPLESGVHVPSTHAQLRVDFWIDNAHREEDSRFLLEWRREDEWFSSTASLIDVNSTWSDATTRYITGISPGSYRLRVRGRDFAGRESTPVEFRIVIDAPWWRSWPAVLAYACGLVAVLVALYRWRVGVLRAGTAQLIESDKRLRASEGKFRALFDRSTDAHLLVERGQIVGANAMAAQLFGAPAGASLVGRALADVLPTHVDAVPGRGAQDVTLHRADEIVPAQLTVTSITTDAGPMLHLVLRDLTEVRAAERARERMEAHLRERQRLESLGTLAGGVAHDFNNLLGVIRGNAELADESLDVGSPAHEHLESIVDASDRARDLVQQILTFSRNPSPRKTRVDLSALITALQPLLRRMIPSSVEIVLQGVDTPHIVEGDPTQLEQVLLNLASNAEYAMREHASGRLTMGVTASPLADDGQPPHGAVVRLIVSDTGVGMTDTVREHVFEPFFTTKPTGEGTGLGLAVIHGIVAAHGGRVQLTSAPGAGTTVDVEFPSADETLRDTSADNQAVVGRGAADARSGARLIVVDDEPSVARVLERSLTRAGYAVRVFSDPRTALQAIADAPDAVDLLLTDQTMPGLTGDVLTERVLAIAPTLPVLILTGFSHRLTSEKAAAVGARAVLQKPIALEELHRAVAHALMTPLPTGADIVTKAPG